MDTQIVNKLEKYAEEHSWSELAELLSECKNGEVKKELGVESFKLIEYGTGLEGLPGDVMAIIFSIDGYNYAMLGVSDSWAGSSWDKGIKEVSWKEVTVNEYKIS